jgi:Glycosyl transferases group 1
MIRRRAAATLAPPVGTPSAVRVVVPVFGSLDPLGALAESTAIVLQGAGVHVDIETGEDASFASTFRPEPDADPSALELSFAEPHLWWRAQRPLAGVVTSPTSMAPYAWEIPLRRALAVVVPSRWLAETVAPYRKAALVPFPIDPAFTFAPKARGKRFRVLFSTFPGQERRSGWELARAAFLDAFADREDVELVVRSPRPLAFDGGDPRITFDLARRSSAQMADLYRSVDVLLHPALAEAFGLAPLEAMACGTPAIFTGATGMADYADLGYTVRSRSVPGLNGEGEWRAPIAEGLVDALRACAERHDAEKAARDAATVAQRYDRAAFAKNLLRALA